MFDLLPRIALQALNVTLAAKTEIIIFMIGMLFHTVVFRKYRVQPAPKSRKLGLKLQSLGAADTLPQPLSPSTKYSSLLTQESQTLMSSSDDVESLACRLSRHLRDCAADSVPGALAGFLDETGNAVNAPLLQAVRLVMRERGVRIDSRLGELLLRGYSSIRIEGDFEEVLEEVEASGVTSTAIKILALKASLRSRDLEASIGRLKKYSELLKGKELTPSSAPISMLRNLVRLASQKGALSDLARALNTMGLLRVSLDVLLSESTMPGDESAIDEIIRLVRSESDEISPASYASMIKVCATSNDALCLFQEAAHGNSGAHQALPTEFLLVAASRAADRSDRALGAAVLQHLPSEPPGALACSLLRLHVDRCAAGALEEDDGDLTDAGVLELYARHFAGADLSGDPATELRLVEAAVDHGRSDLLGRLLSASHCNATRQAAILKGVSAGSEGRGDRGDELVLRRALAIFRTCAAKTTSLYNAMLELCVRCRESDVAAQIMDEALEAECADIVTYNTMIKLHLTSGNFVKANELVEGMRVGGFQPNRVTFNEMIEAQIKQSGKVPWDIIEEMRTCGVRPDNITCSILLKTIQSKSKGASIDRVMEVLGDLDMDMDDVLLGSTVEACIRVGRVDLLVQILRKQRNSRRVEVRSPHTYGSIIRAYGFIHDISGVWETWLAMRMRRIIPTSITVGCMVEALVTNGEPEAGYDLICELQADVQCRTLVNAVVYCSVLKGFAHQKKFDRAWSVYQEMLTQKVQFSIVTFNTLVDACARSREMHRIPAILEDMVAQGIEPNLVTRSAIIKGYCQEGRLDKALELMDTMRQSENGKFRPDEVTYNTLLDGCARQNMYDRGMQLLVEMQEAGVQPTNFTLSVLVKVATRCNKLDKAFELCEELSQKYDFNLNVHVFNNLVHGCLPKNIPRALAVLERMVKEGVRPDVRTYMLVLKALIAVGEVDEAASLLRASAGLRGGHPRLAGLDSRLLQPQPQLPAASLEEVIEGIAAKCQDDRLLMALIGDLRRLPWVKLDPKLQLRLAMRMTHA